MKRVALLLLIIAALLPGGGGCAAPSSETGRNSNPPLVLTLMPTPKHATATGHIGDELRFVIPSTRGPDYVWQIVTNDPRSLRQSGKIVYTPATGTEEAKSTVGFIAQRPSRSFLRFAYVPVNGGKEEEAVDAYEIFVTIRG